MTNETDLRECSAQIELIRQLINQPETFDLNKVLIKLETKKKLLMTFKPRSYDAILEDLESGAIIHPGEFVFKEKEIENPKETKKLLETREAKAEEIRLAKEAPEEPKITAKAKKEIEEKAILDKELQIAKDKVAELEALKEEEKKEETTEIGE